MKKTIEKMWTTSIITSILLIFLGLFLFFQPETTISIIAYTIGGIIIISGVGTLYKSFKKNQATRFNLELTLAVITIIAGLIIVLNKEALASLLPLILGIWMTVSSTTKLQHAFTLKTMNNNSWISTLIVALLIITWGILLIFNPFKGALAITKLIGLFIMVYAILNIIESYLLKKNIKDFTKSIVYK